MKWYNIQDTKHHAVVWKSATDIKNAAYRYNIQDANHYAVVWKPATDIISVA